MTFVRFSVSMLRRLWRRQDGIAAVEAAIVMPFMILLFMGSVELSFGIIADRKLTVATQTVADLVTQFQTASDASINGVYNAAQRIMDPYDTSTLEIDVTAITVDAAGNASVLWTEHRPDGGTPKHAANDPIVLPQDINTPNSFIILVEGEYGFTAGTQYVMQGEITMNDQFYMRPRIADTITFN